MLPVFLQNKEHVQTEPDERIYTKLNENHLSFQIEFQNKILEDLTSTFELYHPIPDV